MKALKQPVFQHQNHTRPKAENFLLTYQSYWEGWPCQVSRGLELFWKPWNPEILKYLISKTFDKALNWLKNRFVVVCSQWEVWVFLVWFYFMVYLYYFIFFGHRNLKPLRPKFRKPLPYYISLYIQLLFFLQFRWTSQLTRSVGSWTTSITSETCLWLLMWIMANQLWPILWSAKLELLLAPRPAKLVSPIPERMSRSVALPLSQRKYHSTCSISKSIIFLIGFS